MRTNNEMWKGIRKMDFSLENPEICWKIKNIKSNFR